MSLLGSPRPTSLTRLAARAIPLALTATVAVVALPGTAQAATAAANTYTQRTGAGFDAGIKDRTAVSNGRLVMASPTRTVRLDGKTYLTAGWTSDWITPSHTFTELIPSWQATTPANTFVGVSLQVRDTTGRTSTWDSVARWAASDATFKRTSFDSQPDDLARMAVDTLVSNGAALKSWRIKLTLNRTSTAAAPSVRTVGAVASRIPSAVPTSQPSSLVGTTIDVPRSSQMTHKGHFPQYAGGGASWCSPTSLSMVARHFGAMPAARTWAWTGAGHAEPWVDHFARQTYDYGFKATGNWSFNTAYAAQYADQAFVTRLESLRLAERFIASGIPVIASVSFDRGGLTGAPLSSTPGHLMVIVGFTKTGDVVVNDPAAGNNNWVRRTYDRAQFERAWQTRSHGLAYIVRDGATRLPARSGATGW